MERESATFRLGQFPALEILPLAQWCCASRRWDETHMFVLQVQYMSQAGPSEYSILDSNSEFFVLLELDSDQTLLEPSSEKYKFQKFQDFFNNSGLMSIKYEEDIFSFF